MTARSPVPDFVRLHARGRPTHPALIDAVSRRVITYAALDRRVDAAVGLLRGAFGFERGDRLAAIARNHVDLIVLQLACARGGLIFVPLNWRLSAAELALLIEDCAPRLIVGDALAGAVEAAVPRVALDEIGRRLDAADMVGTGAADADAPSLMLYTSGTSGRSKGVLLTESNLFATAVNSTILVRVAHDSVFLVDSPCFHVIGMVTSVRPPIMMGATSIISPGFDPATTLARLADPALAVTHYFCVPQMAQMLRACPGFDPQQLRGLTALFTGGAPHPAPRIREWLDDGICVVDGYGMTECGTVLGMPVDPGIIAAKAGSAGLLAPTIEARIVDEEGRECHDGEVGEILLRGANIFSRYWERPRETADAFTEDGYFRTGDLVRRDPDGFHYLVDRKKDMFISGGENVYPAEVEAVLVAHSDVEQVAVVGVPDDRWGEVGHAAVVLRSGAPRDATSLLAHCARSLARFKLPKKVHFVAQLPRTASGKVLKNELKRELARSSQGDAGEQAT